MKKSKFIVLVLSILIAGTFLFTNENLFKADETKDTIIVEGVYIGGVNVSGMTEQEATDAVNAYVDTLKAETVILKGPKAELELTYADLGLTAKVDAAVSEAMTIAQSGSLIQRYMRLKDLEKDVYVVDMGLAIDKQLVGRTLYDKQNKLNIKAIDNTIVRKNGKFEYVPGQTGDEIVIEDSVNALSKLVSGECEIAIPENNEFELTSIVSEPRGSEEEFSKVTDLLGTYATDYGWSAEGRKTNVQTGCDRLNGIVLFPGDEVSVRDVTGPYNEANGYAKAGTYEDGNVVDDYGGGICQVASTIYNAALLSELEITERKNHSMVVGYGGMSGDAAIAGDYKDLRFANNYDTPIYIEAGYNGSFLWFNIYGEEVRPENREIRYEGEVISENDPETEYTLSGENAVGSYIVTREKHIGYSAKLWKIVTIDGVDAEKIQINKSYYIASCAKVTIGTKDATAEQLAKIEEVLATKDDDKIKEVILGLTKPEDPETPSTENEAGTTTTPENSDDSETGNDSGTPTTPSTGEESGTTPAPEKPAEGQDENQD